MRVPGPVFALAIWAICLRSHASQVTGQLTNTAGPVSGARVTLFTTDLLFFREARSDISGVFSFERVGLGSYRLGVAALGDEYQETNVSVTGLVASANFNLRSETNGGRWTIVGNTAPELLDGTGSGTLLPSGEVLFCHDTEDPIVFDPVAALKWFPPTSGSGQGCHIPTLNTDGTLFLAGGSEDGYPQGVVVKTVKQYWRNTNGWSRLPDMNVPRWYPGIVRFPDERLMVLGGEQNGSPGRTTACEIYDPITRTWTNAAPFALPSEITPTVLLYNGELLKTWRYPEFYNISSNQWRAAPNMVQTRLGASNGDHCDHEIVFMPDGRVMAVGISPTVLDANTRFVEFYSPSNNTWSLGPNPRALRRQPEALILPDGRVLAFGGQYSGPMPAPVPLANAGTIPNCTKVCDIYDPASDSWRALADMNRFIHYHNVTVLVPDGRVIATGGAGLTATNSFAGDDMSIEAYEPPYLFRGVRPRIDSLSTTDLVLGSNFTVRISFAEQITKLVLVSARATTHWVDGGPQRFLPLEFVQTGSQIEATLPNDPVRALAGYYILFAMVDDIPSIGRIVRITPAVTPRPSLPNISVTTLDATASESGDTGTFRITRTGSTNAPLTVRYSLSGSAVNGSDFNTLSNYIVIPAGSSNANITVVPVNDNLSEGEETVSLNLFDTTGYNAGPLTNAVVTISDDDPTPIPFALQINALDAGSFRLTLTGPATRLYSFDAANELNSWRAWAQVVNSNGTIQVLEATDTNHLFFRARLDD